MPPSTASTPVPRGPVLNWLLTLRIDKPPFLIALDVLAAVLALYLLIRPTWKRTLAGLTAALLGGLVGWFLVWLLTDAMDLFGVALTPVTTLWTALGFGGVSLAVANLFRSRWWRKVIAIVSIPVFLAAAFCGINVDFGAYRNLNDALGVVPYKALDLHTERGEVVAGTDWKATAGVGDPGAIPAKGEVGTVRIPGTESRFPARKAVVYLPPIALTANPPALPVLYALSGQPGAPADMFTAGGVGAAMDRFAAAHGGYAPIVVAADQLGGPGRNPMCVDSRDYGNSATYLLTDVRNWVRSNLRVSSDPAGWGVFGYSQGATCAVQFASGRPDLFGSALASSSELGPTLGDEALTISTGFDGSKAAYEAAQPAAMMTKNAPYRDSVMVFGAGANDAKYSAFARTLYGDAERAGVRAQLLSSPGTAHDWKTVRYVLAHGFPAIAAQMGLGS
ncbi:alpha/beta hydrolase-fold protein [Leifsonia shinshuensis]|uniref:alpha/beta hydrolase n=1 Tax=Leifsonia shinshuensis TaxID=150026 RepID=UPI0028578463|nr:alpha/beta hydrolase-fold protein [Leifsonia shinshuensis]MDR6970471.1 enterochelin esterase-like enzyme [Leifsonia shinshuensis]